MKKILKITLFGIVALAITVLTLLGLNGAFNDIVIQEGKQGGYWTVGVDHTGPYHEIGQAFEELTKIREEEKLDTGLTLGIYYDDPDEVNEAELRSVASFRVKDSIHAIELFDKHPQLHVVYIPKVNSFYTELPTDGMFQMIISVMKAYEAFGGEIDNSGRKFGAFDAAFEEYLEGGKVTRYIMPVE